MSSAVGIWLPFSILETFERAQPSDSASCTALRPAADRSPARRSASPPGAVSCSLAGRTRSSYVGTGSVAWATARSRHVRYLAIILGSLMRILPGTSRPCPLRRDPPLHRPGRRRQHGDGRTAAEHERRACPLRAWHRGVRDRAGAPGRVQPRLACSALAMIRPGARQTDSARIRRHHHVTETRQTKARSTADRPAGPVSAATAATCDAGRPQGSPSRCRRPSGKIGMRGAAAAHLVIWWSASRFRWRPGFGRHHADAGWSS